jgi:hypothetical protein
MIRIDWLIVSMWRRSGAGPELPRGAARRVGRAPERGAGRRRGPPGRGRRALRGPLQRQRPAHPRLHQHHRRQGSHLFLSKLPNSNNHMDKMLNIIDTYHHHQPIKVPTRGTDLPYGLLIRRTGGPVRISGC